MTSKITSLPDLLIWLNYRNRAQKDICDSDGKCLIMTSILLVKKAKSIYFHRQVIRKCIIISTKFISKQKHAEKWKRYIGAVLTWLAKVV